MIGVAGVKDMPVNGIWWDSDKKQGKYMIVIQVKWIFMNLVTLKNVLMKLWL